MRDAFTHANGYGYSNCGDFGDAYSNRNGNSYSYSYSHTYGNGNSNFDAHTHEPAEG